MHERLSVSVALGYSTPERAGEEMLVGAVMTFDPLVTVAPLNVPLPPAVPQ